MIILGRDSRMPAMSAMTALALACAGCVTVRAPGFMRSPAARGWPATLQTAQAEAAAGRFAAADSTLTNFAREHAGSPEALETKYWLGLYELDPDNEGANLDSATVQLDDYLAASGPRPHLAEAAELSRVALTLRSLSIEANVAVAHAKASGAATAAANERASEAQHADTASSSDAEVRRLRDELAKANAELERIRKRLTNGGKPPGR